MGVVSVTVGGLNVHDGIKYATSAETLTMLEAMSPHEPVMVDMANRPPVYVRTQIQARPISLTVFLIRPNALDRKTDFDALKAALDPSIGLVPLVWVDDFGPTTKTLQVHASSCIPSNWMARASAELVAPDPEPIVT